MHRRQDTRQHKMTGCTGTGRRVGMKVEDHRLIFLSERAQRELLQRHRQSGWPKPPPQHTDKSAILANKTVTVRSSFPPALSQSRQDNQLRVRPKDKPLIACHDVESAGCWATCPDESPPTILAERTASRRFTRDFAPLTQPKKGNHSVSNPTEPEKE